MSKNSISLTTSVAIALAATAAPSGAAAQSTSRVTPQNIAPVEKSGDGSIVLPQNGMSIAPPGADALMVRVQAFDVSGTNGEFSSEIGAITGPLTGQNVSVARLYQAAAQIEALYARSGRILTRVTVPPQRITDGAVVKLVVVEGFIEGVDASSLPGNLRRAIEARAQKLVGRKGLTLAQIERHVLLAGRVPGASLETTLVPGQQVGGAVLILKSGYKAVSAALSTDNRLSDAYRNWNFDMQLVLNSVMGAGEQLYTVASTAQDFRVFNGSPMRRINGVGAIIPIGANGLTYNMEYINANTTPRPVLGAAAIKGKLDRVAMRFKYPVTLTRAESLNVSASFDFLTESQEVVGFNTELTRDRLRFLTLGMDWSKALPNRSVISFDASVAQGFKAFNARTQADALSSGILLSRQGSQPDFSTINASAHFRTALGPLDFGLSARGQASLSGALPGAAMFSLDSQDGLSGFDLGSLNTDSGITGRAELGRRIAAKNVTMTPYVFTAFGSGNLKRPTALERKNINGWSMGGGIRGDINSRVNFSGELSRNHANIFTKDDTRLTVGFGVRF